MTELSDEARDLFDTARRAHEPSGRDRQEVHQAVLLRVGAVAAASSLARAGSGATQGAGAASVWAGKGIIATKFVVGLALMGSAGTGAYYVARSPAEPPRAAHVAACSQCELPPPAQSSSSNSEPRGVGSNPPSRRIDTDRSAAVAPVVSPSPAPPMPDRSHRLAVLDRATAPASNEPPSNGASEPAISAFPDLPPARTTTPTVLPEAPPSSALTLEAQGLSMVQQALRDGRGAEALALLDQQERTFREGKLELERQAARIIALCAVGRQSEARAFAARFLARAPSSFLATRVRKTCAGQL